MKTRTFLLYTAGLIYFLTDFWISSVLAQDVGAGFPPKDGSAFFVAEKPAPTLAQIIEKVESHRRGWLALKADIELKFLTADQRSASCNGELTYERLDEKILLRCFNAKREPLFIFRTTDRKFDLYLPGEQALFRGDIFDLDDSPDIESHLKPLDLYRALKTMVLPLEQTEIEREDGGTISLRVFGQNHRGPYLARRLFVTNEGEVPVEMYYDFEGSPSAVIRRHDFKKLTVVDGRKSLPTGRQRKKISFPYQIVMEETRKNGGKSPQTTRTVILFKDLRLLAAAHPEDWLFAIPRQTRITHLPRLLLRHTMNGPEPVT